MSSASSAVTYTSVYTYSEPGRPVSPPSPDYIPSPEELQAPLLPDFVPEPVYPEFLVPSNAEAPMEEQSYAADASPTTLSSGYVADSDPEEDPEEKHTDYPADGGDDDDDDDDDADDEEEETSNDEEEEEEHLAPVDPSIVPVVDPVPSAGDTEAVEAEEPAPAYGSPHTRVLFS
ncbi:hypothetical protein Tco_1290806 [Tanacetum coccineum]